MTREELAIERAASRERRESGAQPAVDAVRALRASEDSRKPYSERYKTRGEEHPPHKKKSTT